MDETRSRKLEQVRKLLDKASDSGTSPAEAEALRNKADDLMLAYAISEFEVQQRKAKGEREMPERRSIAVITTERHPLKTQLVDLFGTVVTHARCRAVYSGITNPHSRVTATVVGFPTDLEYLEMMFTSLQVQLANNLEPHPDPNLTYEENLCLLKEAGMKWERVWELLFPGEPWNRSKAIQMLTNRYTAYCNETGRPRLRTSPITYQRNFAEGYNAEVWRRFYDMRKRQQEQHVGGSGMELALRDMKSEVDDMFGQQFAGVKGVNMGGRSKLDHAASSQGEAAGRRADLGQGKMTSRKELT
jgi:hypothetical protein